MKIKIIVNILILVILMSCSSDIAYSEINITKIQQISKLAHFKVGNNCDYTNFSIIDADFVVTNSDSLIASISKAKDGDIIYLKNDNIFNFKVVDLPITIKKSIKIVSNRISNNPLTGAVLKVAESNDTSNLMFDVESDSVTFSGLRIIGPYPDVGSETIVVTWRKGISIDGFNSLRVENCEISGWTDAGIEIKDSKGNKIVQNHIHHNRRLKSGYGIVLRSDNILQPETNAIISCNDFEFNRHDIAGSGQKNQSYEACYNIVGEPGFLTHRFDMHGKNNDSETIAGGNISIHHNIFESDKDFAFLINGIPEVGVQIYNNEFAHKCKKKAIKQTVLGVTQNLENWKLMNVSDDNIYRNSDNIEEIDIGNDFLLLDTNDDILKYTFGDECECNKDLSIIGNNFDFENNLKDIFIGNWIGNGTDDLIALSNDDKLYLYPYDGDFWQSNSGTEVGNGFHNFKDFFAGNWMGNGTDDLIALSNDDKLYLYPFNGSFWQPNAGTIIGTGFHNYKDFIFSKSPSNKTQLIAINKSNEVDLFTLDGNSLIGPIYIGCIKGEKDSEGNEGTDYKRIFKGKWK